MSKILSMPLLGVPPAYHVWCTCVGTNSIFVSAAVVLYTCSCGQARKLPFPSLTRFYSFLLNFTTQSLFYFTFMKVIEHIQKAKDETLFSIEILPPQKGKTIDDLLKVIEPFMEFKPPFIDVTYHPEEMIVKKNPDGSVYEVPLRKRPGTVGICAAIQNKLGVDAVPHLVCHGFTKEETEDALFTLHYLGIDNVLLLKGDDKMPTSNANKRGHQFANQLVTQVADLNNGKYLYEETANELKTNFCIGVAGYPEKHFEAPNMIADLNNLKRKVEAGADYIVTQMFFDNKKYFDFVDLCRQNGITIPIIPGLKPIDKKAQLKVLPSMFYIDLPQDLVLAIDACKDDQAAKQIGIEWAIMQSKELKAAGVPVLHYYTMSRSESVVKIASAVF